MPEPPFQTDSFSKNKAAASFLNTQESHFEKSAPQLTPAHYFGKNLEVADDNFQVTFTPLGSVREESGVNRLGQVSRIFRHIPVLTVSIETAERWSQDRD